MFDENSLEGDEDIFPEVERDFDVDDGTVCAVVPGGIGLSFGSRVD